MRRSFVRIGVSCLLYLFLCATICILVSNRATAAGNTFTYRIDVVENKVTFSGVFPDGGHDPFISIFVLKPGYSGVLIDTENAIEYMGIESVDNADCFSHEFSVSSEVDHSYSLYAKSGGYTLLVPLMSAGIPRQIHVSTIGNAGGTGSVANPVSDLDGARRLARRVKHSGVEIDILIHAGIYSMDEQVVFTAADSGKYGNPIRYMAAGDGSVKFSGSTELDVSGFASVTDQSVLERVPRQVRNKLLVMDLAEQGITQEQVSVRWDPLSSNEMMPPYFYLNGKEQDISRWPNTGYVVFESIVKPGEVNDPGIFAYEGMRPERWLSATDAYLEGYFNNEYVIQSNRASQIDVENKTITMERYHAPLEPNHRWAIVNLIEEIDLPGEWFVDIGAMKLYYYPPHELVPGQDVFELIVCNGFINLDGAEHLSFEGLNFEYSKSPVISSSSPVKGISVTNCSFTNVKSYFSGCVAIDGSDLLLEGNDFVGTNYTAIRIQGGDRSNITPSGNVVRDNYIASSRRGIRASGVGNVVENNLIHALYSDAINLNGPENIVRFNEAHSMLRERGDSAVMGCGRSWVSYGSRFDYNFLYNFGPEGHEYKYNDYGFFLDDTVSGIGLKGNIIAPGSNESTQGIHLGGGRDNTITDNIVVGATYALYANDRTWYSDVREYPAYASLSTVPFDQEPWISKYPQVADIYNDIEANNGVFRPLNNIARENLFVDFSEPDMISSRLLEFGQFQNKTSDYDVFINPSDGDYRITNTAAAELDLSVPNEDFSLDSVGIGRTHTFDGAEFANIYPKNGSVISTIDAELKWERAAHADEYVYIVASDPNMENVVTSGVVFDNIAEIRGLLAGGTYYWKVKARYLTRGDVREWETDVSTFNCETVQLDIYNLSIQNGNAEFYVTNLSSFDFDAEFFIVLKGNDGRLLYVSTENVTVLATDEDRRLSYPIDVEKIESGGRAEVFCLDSAIRPLAQKARKEL